MAFPDIELNMNFPFGKHKGKPVHEVIVEDPGYFLWLREQRWIADATNKAAGFSEQIHELLDDYILTLPMHKRTQHPFYKTREDKPPVEIGVQPMAEPAKKPEEWGAWA